MFSWAIPLRPARFRWEVKPLTKKRASFISHLQYLTTELRMVSRALILTS